MERAGQYNSYYITQLMCDLLFLCLSFFLALWLGRIYPDLDVRLPDVLFLLYLVFGWYLTSIRYHLYPPSFHQTWLKQLFASFNVILVEVLLCILFSFTFKEQNYGRGFVVIYGLLLFVFMPISKMGVRHYFRYVYGRGHHLKRAIVIGDGISGKRFCLFISNNPLYGYQLVKYIHGEMIIRANRQAMDKLRRMASGRTSLGRIDEVFITESSLGNYDAQEVMHILGDYAVQLRLIPKAVTYAPNMQLQVSMLGDFPLFSYSQEPLENVFNQFIKRMFDLVFSLLVCLFICSWLMPLIALLIRLESRGPVFFLQERWGKRNKPFKCFKFRSMYCNLGDADGNGTFKQAQKGDKRITRIGKILRKTNLDEFPQFLNVLRGDMSVVGPRPHATLMNLEALSAIGNYLVRHQTKPGITGWAQVNGLRGESCHAEQLEERVAYDVWYIQHWTFWLDVRIIFLTFWKMVVGDRNAY